MTKTKKSVAKVEPSATPRARTPLLAGQRRPGVSFHLPPKMAGAIEACGKSGEDGTTFAVLSRRFGPQTPTTLLLLGFLELDADQKFRVSPASEEWMKVHRSYRTSSDVPGTRQANDLSAEREQHVLKLCQAPKDYEAVTRVCGDVSILFLIEAEMVDWVAPNGEKRPVWQRGEGRLQTTEKGMDFLSSQKR